EELSFELNNFKDTLHYDAERLNEIETRLHEIDRLKKKYGSTVNEMLEYMAEIEEELEQIHNKDSHLNTLQKQIDETAKDAYLGALNLHHIRKRSAHSLTKEIPKELKSLYIETAQFSIAFHPPTIDQQIRSHEQLHKNGIDR